LRREARCFQITYALKCKWKTGDFAVTERTPVHAADSASPVSRRTLFAGAGAAGALAAAAALLPRTPTSVSEVAAAAIEPAGDGYQLTEHVQHYYRTARI
jgi:hypothetical protein